MAAQSRIRGDRGTRRARRPLLTVRSRSATSSDAHRSTRPKQEEPLTQSIEASAFARQEPPGPGPRLDVGPVPDVGLAATPSAQHGDGDRETGVRGSPPVDGPHPPAEPLCDLTGTDQLLGVEAPWPACATTVSHQLASAAPRTGRRPRTADTGPSGRHLAPSPRYVDSLPRLRAQRWTSGQYQT